MNLDCVFVYVYVWEEGYTDFPISLFSSRGFGPLVFVCFLSSYSNLLLSI